MKRRLATVIAALALLLAFVSVPAVSAVNCITHGPVTICVLCDYSTGTC